MKTTQEILDDNDPLEMEWVVLELTEGRTNIRIRVTADAVKADGRRLPVSIQQHQEIARRCDASLLTPKICDVIHARADIRVPAEVLETRGPAVLNISQQIDTAVEKGVMNLAAGTQKLGDDRKVPLVSNVGLNWVLSSTWRSRPNGGLEYAQHGRYDPCVTTVSPVMPWMYRCRFGDCGEVSGDSSSIHFARLVHGDVEIGDPKGRGRVTWTAARLAWSFMHTSYAPMLHHDRQRLTWTKVPDAPPAPAR